MTFLRCYVFLLFVISASFLSFSEPAKAEALEAAVESALLYHPSVESARAGVSSAMEGKREEFSGYFPELSVSATGGRIFGDNSTSRGLSVTRGDGYSYLWDGNVTARQMLFDGFEAQNRIDSAAAKERSASMDLTDVRENIALRAAQSYVNVMRARTGLLMLKEHEKKVNDYLGRIKASVDEGAADDAEYQQARDVRVILLGFITDYEGQIAAAEADYAEVIGRFPDADMMVPRPNLDLIPSDIKDALKYADSSHPSLRSAMFTSRSAKYDIESEKAQLYPDLDGELSYLKTDKEDIIGGEAIDARAVVRLNWNFETGGAQLARIKKKRYEHKEALAKVNEIKRQMERGIYLAYSELGTSQGQLKNQQQRNDLNTKLFATYKVQFDGARISLLQLMQADNQLFNTRLEKLNGEYRVLAAQYAVLASIGLLQHSLNLALADSGAGSSSKFHEQN